MRVIVIIFESEFQEEILKSEEKVFFLDVNKKGKITLKEDISLEQYENIVLRVLTRMVRELGFILGDFSFNQRKRWFELVVNIPFEKKVNYLNMKLKDFIFHLTEEKMISFSLLEFLEKCRKTIGENITVREMFLKYHYLVPHTKKGNVEEIIDILEEDLTMDEAQRALIESAFSK